MPNILIENGSIVTVNDSNEVIPNGYIFTEDDKIVALGAGSPPASLRRQADQCLDATFMAVMPGMINAHTHLCQIFMRGLADDKPLLEWLKSAIWPVSSALTEEDAYVAGLVGFLGNIRSGATAVVEHQYANIDPCNNSQDMRETLKMTACLQKVGTLNAMALYPEDVLVMRGKKITVVDEKAILARSRTVCAKLFERAQALKYSLDQVKW